MTTKWVYVMWFLSLLFHLCHVYSYLKIPLTRKQFFQSDPEMVQVKLKTTDFILLSHTFFSANFRASEKFLSFHTFSIWQTNGDTDIFMVIVLFYFIQFSSVFCCLHVTLNSHAICFFFDDWWKSKLCYDSLKISTTPYYKYLLW